MKIKKIVLVAGAQGVIGRAAAERFANGLIRAGRTKKIGELSDAGALGIRLRN